MSRYCLKYGYRLHPVSDTLKLHTDALHALSRLSPDPLQTLYRLSTDSLQTLYRHLHFLSLSLSSCLSLFNFYATFVSSAHLSMPCFKPTAFSAARSTTGAPDNNQTTMIQMFQMFQLCFGHFGHPPFPQYASADTSIILHLCINVYHFRFVHHRCIDAEYLPKKHIKHNCIRNINVPCIRAEVYVWGKRDVGI